MTDHYRRAEQYLDSAERVRQQMIELEEADKLLPKKQKKVGPAQLDHAVQAIRNFGLLAQAHAELAMVDQMRTDRATLDSGSVAQSEEH